MTRSPLPRALLPCIGLLGGLLIAEVTLRIVFHNGLILQAQSDVPDTSVEDRANRHLSMQGKTFTYDENGFRRGTDLPHDRTVLFVGDSFTEGFGVNDDETFARATENALRRDGIMARSLNAGNRGFGAAQELRVLRRMLGRMPVDAVVVQSFPMNDYSDNIAFGGFGLEDDHLVEYDAPRPPLRARLAGFVARSWLQNLYAMRLASNAMLLGDPAAPFNSPTGFDLERALLGEMLVAVAKRPLVMLVIPTKVVQQVQHGIPASPNQLGEVQRFEQVCAYLKESEVSWIDAGVVIPDLEADAAKGDGGHFSRDGNLAIGEAIAQRLAPMLQAQGDRGE